MISVSLAQRLIISATALAFMATTSAHTAQAQSADKGEPVNLDFNLQFNQRAERLLRIPPFFAAPFFGFQKISHNDTTKTNSEAPLVFNYYESTSKIRLQKALELRPDLQGGAEGLRLITVKGSAPRKQTSANLAESQIFETGDVALSFRKEWYQTLKYSHIQLGISHAGIFYYETGADGKRYLKNLDMPLDSKHVNNGYMDSEHYLGAPLLHVVRARDLSAKQKENLNGWLQRLAKKGPAAYAAGKIRFNQDYATPNFRPGQPLKFVGDLGRIALDIANKNQLTNYCSEFVWSILSLKNCDPTDSKIVKSFANDAAPSCISAAFDPMPVLGTITTASDKELKSETQTVGLADGIPLMMRYRHLHIEDPATRSSMQDAYLAKSVYNETGSNATNISSGHRAVEEQLMKQNPKFFDYLLGYYQMVNDKDASANPQVNGMRQAFNSAQYPNYSPTAFMVHALLPNTAAIKRMNYVGTIFYAPSKKTKNGKVISVYDVVRKQLVK